MRGCHHQCGFLYIAACVYFKIVNNCAVILITLTDTATFSLHCGTRSQKQNGSKTTAFVVTVVDVVYLSFTEMSFHHSMYVWAVVETLYRGIYVVSSRLLLLRVQSHLAFSDSFPQVQGTQW